jgi:hypothetical protein
MYVFDAYNIYDLDFYNYVGEAFVLDEEKLRVRI